MKEDEEIFFDEARLCFGDALASRAVVGRGERTLLPGHVHERGHHGGLQGVPSVLVSTVYNPYIHIYIYKIIWVVL